MKFHADLIPGKLIQRYKRFLADVELADGSVITAHCANPGAMLGLKEPGSTVWLSPAANPKRKLKFSWELVEQQVDGKPAFIGINTAHPNKLVEEAITDGTISELQNYSEMRREVKYGTNSRIDLLLSGPKKPSSPHEHCYVEVKNVHLLRQKGIAEFPDSVTARGAKHLAELAEMVNQGHRAVMIYVIQRSDATHFNLAADIDPAYATAFAAATRAGVEAIAYQCTLNPGEIKIAKPLPIRIG